MDYVLSPKTLDPENELMETIVALEEQVRKVAALRQLHEERTRGFAALSAEVAEREAAITRIAEQLDRDPPIFTETQKTELLGLLGRK